MSDIPPQQPVGSSGAPGYPQKPRNGIGIAALVVGILAIIAFLSVIGGVILGLIAIILGFVGRGRAKRGEATNGGMAIAGAVLGVVAILLSLLWVFFLNDRLGDEFDNLQDCLDQADNQEDRDQCAEDFQDEVEEETDN
jgi:drug/metabolite transporter superfamily protein YnfA